MSLWDDRTVIRTRLRFPVFIGCFEEIYILYVNDIAEHRRGNLHKMMEVDVKPGVWKHPSSFLHEQGMCSWDNDGVSHHSDMCIPKKPPLTQYMYAIFCMASNNNTKTGIRKYPSYPHTNKVCRRFKCQGKTHAWCVEWWKWYNEQNM